MKSINKFYVFLLFISILFWNPLSFFLVFGNTTSYDNRLIHISFWLIFASEIAVIFLLRADKLKRIKNYFLFISLTGILYAVLVIMDGALGLVVKSSQKDKAGKNLIFEANSVAFYKTKEFSFKAAINSLGLRGNEFQIDKGNKFRILCIGDSWTYGWGVDEENSWPSLLAVYLKEAGISKVEVINCGESGQYTGSYLTIASKVVPLLKPDLVLVGVLQADDLSQCYEMSSALAISNRKKDTPLSKRAGNTMKAFFHASFHNIIHTVSKDIHHEPIDITADWESSSAQQIDELDHLQALRFSTFDDTLQDYFRSGNLNPGLLHYYLDFPDRFYVFNNPHHKATIMAALSMRKDIDGINIICKKEKAGLVFVNLPEPVFTGHRITGIFGDLLNNHLYNENHVDSIYASVARQTGIPYIELTERFKVLQDKTSCFYRYDGHPTAKGYGEIANGIGEFLISRKLVAQ
ncbi:MAG: Lipolytic protein G-D-S-L family [Bacteroidetes bacterium]|nr:MAG: Lipolytic protein G-D-S-L family [Bacteroidota bacterium]